MSTDNYARVKSSNDVKVGDIVCVGGDSHKVLSAQSFEGVMEATMYSAPRIGRVVGFTPSGRINVELTNRKEPNGKPVKMQFWASSYSSWYEEYAGGHAPLQVALTVDGADWWAQAERAWVDEATANKRRKQQEATERRNAAQREREERKLAALVANCAVNLTYLDTQHMTGVFVDKDSNPMLVVLFVSDGGVEYDLETQEEYEAVKVNYTAHVTDRFERAEGRPGSWYRNDVNVRKGADNMPESLQYGSQAEAMRAVAEELYEYADELEGFQPDEIDLSNVNEQVTEDMDEEAAWDALESEAQEVLDAWIESVTSEAESLMEDVPEYSN